MEYQGLAIFYIIVGIFLISGSFFNWDWFMKDRSAWFIVKLLGRNGARVVYVVFGVGIFVLGFIILMSPPTGNLIRP